MAVLAALTAVLVWGASFAATKLALAEMSVPTLLFGRAALGTAVVALWAFARGDLRRVPGRDVGWVVLLALAGNVIPQLLQGEALLRSTSASTAWLVAVIPVVTAILAWAMLGERLEGKGTGIALAFAGVVIVVAAGESLTTVLGLPSTRGDAMTLASTLSWALYTIWGRGFVARHSATVSMLHFLGASVLVLSPPFVIGSGWTELASLSTNALAALLFLGIGCSALAGTLWYVALERMEASRLAAFIYLEPLVAQVLSRVMLGEPLRATTVAGGAAILLGVWMVARAGAQKGSEYISARSAEA